MSAIAQNIPAHEYHSLPGISLTRLKLMEESYAAWLDNAPAGKEWGPLGELVHTAVLEPDLLNVTVFPGRMDKRTKAYKEFAAEHEGETIINQGDWAIVDGIRASVARHPAAQEYLAKGQAELSIFWKHPIGFDCRSRIDWLTDDVMMDLKSAQSVTPRRFGKQVADLYYYAQMAFYHDAAKALDGRDRKCVMLAAQKSAPYDVVPYRLPEEAVMAGRRLYQDWLLKLKKHQDNPELWRGISDVEIELHLPEYVFSDMDDARIVMPDGTEIAA